MPKKQPQSEADRVKKHFDKDTAVHSMEVIKDDGEFRHLKFSRNGSSVYQFCLTTWPGYLCISGDMGDFVFSRLRDMFTFFRGDHGINPHYWAEKVKAGVTHEWSQELFERNVKEHVMCQFYDSFLKCRKAMRSVKENIFDHNDGEWESVEAIHSWNDPDKTGLQFDDFWEYDCKDYTYCYLWCCYAIVWGIQRYDLYKGVAQAEAVIAE